VDYTLSAGSVTFAAGDTSKNISFSITDDGAIEGAESFTVTLGTPTTGTATLGASVAHQVNIIDNDFPALSINNVTVNEGSVATFTISLSIAAASNVTVDWGTVPGTALAGTHYTTANNTATIIAGNLSTTVNVTSIQTAGVCDANRAFQVHLSNPANATISVADGTGTIQDIDVPTVSVANANATEGSALNVVATLSTACPSKNVTFTWANASGTATSGVDFVGMTGQTGTITAGSTTTNLSTSTNQDTIYEGNETFTVTISAPVNATLGGQTVATATINEDDSMPTVSVANLTVNEGQTANVVLTQSAISGKDTTVHWITADGTADDGTNYTGVPDTVATILAGQTSVNLPVTTIHDGGNFGNKDFTVTISNPTYATLGSPTVSTVTLTDIDPALGAFSISGITGTASDSTADPYLTAGASPRAAWGASANAASYDTAVYQADGVTLVCTASNVVVTNKDFSPCTVNEATNYVLRVFSKDAGGATKEASNSPYLFTRATSGTTGTIAITNTLDDGLIDGTGPTTGDNWDSSTIWSGESKFGFREYGYFRFALPAAIRGFSHRLFLRKVESALFDNFLGLSCLLSAAPGIPKRESEFKGADVLRLRLVDTLIIVTPANSNFWKGFAVGEINSQI
jgi:hypothetical protein